MMAVMTSDTGNPTPSRQTPQGSAPGDGTTSYGHQREEPHQQEGLSQRLNWLRAGVLGANDGIVSVAAVVVGVAGATASSGAIFTAGAAALVGGAVSMALGEYVSVSSQRDSEQALIAQEQAELTEDPEGEFEELVGLYRQRGLSDETSRRVAEELTGRDALDAHLDAELNIDRDDVVSPWHAAGASFVAFFLGAVLPMLAILLPPAGWRVPVTFVATLVALGITGAIAAHIGGSSRGKAALRVVIGGGLALIVTFVVGSLFDTAGIA